MEVVAQTQFNLANIATVHNIYKHWHILILCFLQRTDFHPPDDLFHASYTSGLLVVPLRR